MHWAGSPSVCTQIPLRALASPDPNLPYPEGALPGPRFSKIGDSAREMEHNRKGIGVVIAHRRQRVMHCWHPPAGDQLTVGHLPKVGSGATMIGANLSLALIGVGLLASPSLSQ